MKAEWLEKWVNALESGEYEQCNGGLHDIEKNSFCCLGVLTDLVMKETGDKWVEMPTPGGGFFKFAHTSREDNSTFLPLFVRKIVGLRVFDPVMRRGLTLADLNDKGVSFKKIAQLIRSRLQPRPRSERNK